MPSPSQQTRPTTTTSSPPVATTDASGGKFSWPSMRPSSWESWPSRRRARSSNFSHINDSPSSEADAPSSISSASCNGSSPSAAGTFGARPSVGFSAQTTFPASVRVLKAPFGDGPDASGVAALLSDCIACGVMPGCIGPRRGPGVAPSSRCAVSFEKVFAFGRAENWPPNEPGREPTFWRLFDSRSRMSFVSASSSPSVSSVSCAFLPLRFIMSSSQFVARSPAVIRWSLQMRMQILTSSGLQFASGKSVAMSEAVTDIGVE